MGRFVFERRIINKLYKYWYEIKKEKKVIYPDIDDIDKDELVEIWDDYCFLIKINYKDNETLDYELIHLGRKIEELYENDNFECSESLISKNLENIYQYIESILDNKDHIIEELDIDYIDKILKTRQCFLPLGKTEKRVDYILGALNYSL